MVAENFFLQEASLVNLNCDLVNPKELEVGAKMDGRAWERIPQGEGDSSQEVLWVWWLMEKDQGKKRHHQKQPMRGEGRGLISKGRAYVEAGGFINHTGFSTNLGEILGHLEVLHFHVCASNMMCVQLCDPMDSGMLGFPVLHYLPEFAQTHVYWPTSHLILCCPFLLLPSIFPNIRVMFGPR